MRELRDSVSSILSVAKSEVRAWLTEDGSSPSTEGDPTCLLAVPADAFAERLPAYLVCAIYDDAHRRWLLWVAYLLVIPPGILSATEFVDRVARWSQPERLALGRILSAIAGVLSKGDSRWYDEWWAIHRSVEGFWRDPSDERLASLLPAVSREQVLKRIDEAFGGEAPIPDGPKEVEDGGAYYAALAQHTWRSLAADWTALRDGSVLALCINDWRYLGGEVTAYYLPAVLTAASQQTLAERIDSDLFDVAVEALVLPWYPSAYWGDFVRALSWEQRVAVALFLEFANEEHFAPESEAGESEVARSLRMFWSEPTDDRLAALGHSG